MIRRPVTIFERLAMEVALCAPLRRNRYSVSATVPWELVEEIRTELENSGVDWKALHKKCDDLVKERNRAAVAEHEARKAKEET